MRVGYLGQLHMLEHAPSIDDRLVPRSAFMGLLLGIPRDSIHDVLWEEHVWKHAAYRWRSMKLVFV